MSNQITIARFFRSFYATVVILFGVIIININYTPLALAGDNYSAATDTYQETRNPNRVNTTAKELTNSKINKDEETQGDSIYDRLVEKVDSRRDASLETEVETSASRK